VRLARRIEYCEAAGSLSGPSTTSLRFVRRPSTAVPGRSAGIKRYPVLGTPGSYGDRTSVFRTSRGTSGVNRQRAERSRALGPIPIKDNWNFLWLVPMATTT